MFHETPILKSKLCLPDRGRSIRRPISRLLGKTILENRLTTIIAGAGYGKTTLSVQALEGLNARVIRLRLDKTDKELTTFLSGLIRGIQKIFPEFNASAIVDNPGNTTCSAADEMLVRQLLVNLEACLDTDLILVLDDLHWVKESEAVIAVLNFLLRHTSSFFHMVLISRASMPLSLSRLKAQRQVIEICAADLVFSGEETALLFKEHSEIEWDRDISDRICELTQGWVSGLMLFHYAFQDLTMADIRKCLGQPNPLPDPVADYVEEEVFSVLAPEIRDFLVQTSILTCLTASLCDEFLHADQSQDMLEHLAGSHIFIEKAPLERCGYVYHRLFKIFLQKKLAVLFSKEAVSDLHLKAAGLYEKKGRIETALHYFLSAPDFTDVVRLLNSHGRRLFQEGRYDILKTCFSDIPNSYMDDFPWVLCLYGKLQGVFANHTDAAKAWGRALVKFESQGNTDGMNLCRIEIASNHYIAGEFSKAAQVLETLLNQPTISDELRIEALGYLIFLTAHLRNKDLWKRYHETSQAAMAHLNRITLSDQQRVWLDIYRGNTALATGNFKKALEIGRSVEWCIRHQADLQDFSGHYALLASACNFLHCFDEGLAYARKGLEGLSRKNSKTLSSMPVWQPAVLTPGGIRDRGRQDMTLPFILLQAAKSTFGLGRCEESIEYAAQCIDLFRSMGTRWGQALGLNAICTAYARKGDMGLAEQSALSGLALIKGLDLPRTEGTLKGNLAVVLMMTDRYEEALPLIQSTREAFEPFGLSHWTELWLAMYLWHRDEDRGREKFLSVLALDTVRKNHDFVAERHWIVPFLVDLYARGHLRDYIFNTLKKIGSDAILDLKQVLRESHGSSVKRTASHLLSNLPKPDPPGLKIYLLGRFRVVVGDGEISAGKWGNQKVRSLFQYLAYSRHQGYVNRDILIEMLWPDQDPGKTINRFHVTMTALRRVLEPDLPDGAPSSYILRQGDTYRLRLGQEGRIDMVVFTDAIARASREKDSFKAFSHFREAVSVYSGELLAEAPFCEWCSTTRQDLQNKYLYALETMIAFYEMQNDFKTCIRYTETYLNIDRTAEKMYRKLMQFHAGTGNLVQTAFTLKRCRETLHLELDCPVEPQTEELAQRLLTGKKTS